MKKIVLTFTAIVLQLLMPFLKHPLSIRWKCSKFNICNTTPETTTTMFKILKKEKKKENNALK